MYRFIDATPDEIPAIQDVAEKTWWPTYSSIITAEQIRYMLDHIYSTEVLTQVMSTESQKFILLEADGKIQAFAAYGPRPEDGSIFKLHKIYVLPENHGRGYGKILIDEVKRRVQSAGGQMLDLNVNRHNPARGFYEKLGFQTIAEEDVSIGPYWMNDYVMRLQLM